MVLANIWFPDNEDRKRIIAAVCTSAGGAGAAVQIAIPNNYPPIDRTIPCPILGILTMCSGAVLAANDNDGFAMAGQMAVAPTGAGEWFINGARTIQIWEITARAKAVLVVYIAKGSGQQT